MIHRRKPQTLETSREEIETSCGAIPVDTLAPVAREPVCRARQYLQTDGVLA
jgi:hypothetical protein